MRDRELVAKQVGRMSQASMVLSSFDLVDVTRDMIAVGPDIIDEMPG